MCLRLVQLGSQVLNLCLELRVNVLVLDCPFITKFLVILRANIDIVEEHECLNKLLNAVNPIGLRSIDCVQKRENDFKSTQAGFVCRILDNGNTQDLVFTPPDSPSVLNLEIVIFRIATKNQNAVISQNILYAHHGGISKSNGIDHKSKSGVKCEDFKRSFVLLHIGFPIRKNHAVGSTANVPPLGQFCVLRRFILRKSVIVQESNRFRDSRIVFPADILNRLPHQITNLEGNDLVGSVLNNFVVDFRANILFPIKNRLVTLVIPIQVVNICLVQKMNEQGLLKNINDVIVVDFGNISINHSASK